MNIAPVEPGDLHGIMKSQMQGVLVYLRHHPAKVMRVHETGENAGLIEVQVNTIDGGTFDADGNEITDPEYAWVPAQRAGSFSNVPPEVGDTVLVFYPDGVNSDRLYWIAHDPAAHPPLKTGEGLKVLFEFETPTGEQVFIYFDRDAGELITEIGDTQVVQSARSITAKAGGPGGTSVEQTTDTITAASGSTRATISGSTVNVETSAATVTAPTISLNGNTMIAGNATVAGALTAAAVLTATGDSIAQLRADIDALRAEYKAHKHMYQSQAGPAETGGPTS